MKEKKTNSGKFELGSDLAFAEIASRALSRPSVVRPLTYDLRDACGRAVSLPAVDAYARLQPVLRAGEARRATCEVAKARLLGLYLFSVIRHRGQRDRKTRH